MLRLSSSTGAASNNALVVVGSAVVAASVTLLGAYYFYGKNEKDSKELAGFATDQVEEVALLTPIQGLLAEALFQGGDQTICSVVLERGSCPSEELVHTTVALLQKRHSPLRAVMALNHDQSDVVLAVTNAPTVSGSVTCVKDTPWQQVVDQQLEILQFPKPELPDRPTTSLWKIFLVDNTGSGSTTEEEDSAIVFVLNHCHFDGTGRNRFLRTFFDTLGEVKNQNGNTLSEAQLPYNLQTLATATPTLAWTKFVPQMVQSVLEELRHRHQTYAFPLEDAPGMKDPHMKKATKWITFSLSQEDTSKVISRSKQEGTTVHGAICAAVHKAMDLVVREKTGNQTDDYSFGILHMVSLWDTIADVIPAEAAAGCKISIKGMRMTTTASLSQQDLWQMARDIKAQLRGFVSWSLPQFIVYVLVGALLETTVVRPPLTYRQLERDRANVFVSNNRAVSYGKYSEGVIKQVYNNVARHSVHGSLGILNLQTVHGSMNLCLTYFTHVWSTETAQSFVDHFQRELLQMCR